MSSRLETIFRRLSLITVQGILTSETRCLNCETITSKDEDFFDLSIDVDQVGITSAFLHFFYFDAFGYDTWH